jgi:hypothetical protein
MDGRLGRPQITFGDVGVSRYPRLCPRKYEELFKEGRGSGTGAEYQPFVTVHDFPSRGRVHRIFGIKTRRVHQLLSGLERNVFLGFEWPGSVTDVREQYPLRLEKTLKIAKDLGVPHLVIRVSRDPFIMTTELSLTCAVGLTSFKSTVSSNTTDYRSSWFSLHGAGEKLCFSTTRNDPG